MGGWRLGRRGCIDYFNLTPPRKRASCRVARRLYTRFKEWQPGALMEIEFDPDKDAINRARHGLSLARAADLDWDGMVSVVDRRRAYGEIRLQGYAELDGRLHMIAFTERGERKRAISLRRANLREIARYARAQTSVDRH